MNPVPYDQLTDEQLVALCVWREARGEGNLGKRAVAHVIQNRASAGGWWGHDWRTVVLKPYQFSSFNRDDPNSTKWPEDDEADWLDCLEATRDVMGGEADITNSAVYYYSPPLSAPPRAWGAVIPAASIGRLTFWKPSAGELNMQGDA